MPAALGGASQADVLPCRPQLLAKIQDGGDQRLFDGRFEETWVVVDSELSRTWTAMGA